MPEFSCLASNLKMISESFVPLAISYVCSVFNDGELPSTAGLTMPIPRVPV